MYIISPAYEERFNDINVSINKPYRGNSMSEVLKLAEIMYTAADFNEVLCVICIFELCIYSGDVFRVSV